jgi:hypothetical protein
VFELELHWDLNVNLASFLLLVRLARGRVSFSVRLGHQTNYLKIFYKKANNRKLPEQNAKKLHTTTWGTANGAGFC